MGEWTQIDHNDLRNAVNLLQGVIDRHRRDISAPAMSCLCEAKHDIDIAEKYLGGDPAA